MKTSILVSIAILFTLSLAAQPGRGPQFESPPEGFKPASTNIFLAEYPEFNRQMHLLFISTGTEERSPLKDFAPRIFITKQ